MTDDGGAKKKNNVKKNIGLFDIDYEDNIGDDNVDENAMSSNNCEHGYHNNDSDVENITFNNSCGHKKNEDGGCNNTKNDNKLPMFNVDPNKKSIIGINKEENINKSCDEYSDIDSDINGSQIINEVLTTMDNEYNGANAVANDVINEKYTSEENSSGDVNRKSNKSDGNKNTEVEDRHDYVSAIVDNNVINNGVYFCKKDKENFDKNKKLKNRNDGRNMMKKNKHNIVTNNGDDSLITGKNFDKENKEDSGKERELDDNNDKKTEEESKYSNDIIVATCGNVNSVTNEEYVSEEYTDDTDHEYNDGVIINNDDHNNGNCRDDGNNIDRKLTIREYGDTSDIGRINKIANDERVKKILSQIFAKINHKKKNNANCVEILKNTKLILKEMLEKFGKNENSPDN